HSTGFSCTFSVDNAARYSGGSSASCDVWKSVNTLHSTVDPGEKVVHVLWRIEIHYRRSGFS
ncbi:MAG: hypothetical protein ACE5HY_05420, partial [Candidatus Hydrothermarchaeales archaeon]